MLRLALVVMGMLLGACSPLVYVLADEEGRPMRVYGDPFACQFSAVWHRERGVEASCHSMSEAQLSLYELREVIRE